MGRRALLRRDATEPMIYITPEAYMKIQCLVDENDLEVGWFGSVERSGDEYVIYDIFLFEQEVEEAETEMDAKSIAKLSIELINNGKEKEVNELRFWGHSHVKMAVNPSTTDESTALAFQENDCDWFICGIFNKGRDIRIDFYDFVHRELWTELPAIIGDPAQYSDIAKSLKSQIKELVYERVRFNSKSGNIQSGTAKKTNPTAPKGTAAPAIEYYYDDWDDEDDYTIYGYDYWDRRDRQSLGVSTGQAWNSGVASMGSGHYRSPQSSKPVVQTGANWTQQSRGAQAKSVGSLPATTSRSNTPPPDFTKPQDKGNSGNAGG